MRKTLILLKCDTHTKNDEFAEIEWEFPETDASIGECLQAIQQAQQATLFMTNSQRPPPGVRWTSISHGVSNDSVILIEHVATDDPTMNEINVDMITAITDSYAEVGPLVLFDFRYPRRVLAQGIDLRDASSFAAVASQLFSLTDFATAILQSESVLDQQNENDQLQEPSSPSAESNDAYFSYAQQVLECHPDKTDEFCTILNVGDTQIRLEGALTPTFMQHAAAKQTILLVMDGGERKSMRVHEHKGAPCIAGTIVDLDQMVVHGHVIHYQAHHRVKPVAKMQSSRLWQLHKKSVIRDLKR